MIRHWSHARQKGWGYPPKKTACQSGLRFQRYKPPKSVTTAGRPLILRFLVYISRNSLRASRSLVIITYFIPSYIRHTTAIQPRFSCHMAVTQPSHSRHILIQPLYIGCTAVIVTPLPHPHTPAYSRIQPSGPAGATLTEELLTL